MLRPRNKILKTNLAIFSTANTFVNFVMSLNTNVAQKICLQSQWSHLGLKPKASNCDKQVERELKLDYKESLWSFYILKVAWTRKQLEMFSFNFTPKIVLFNDFSTHLNIANETLRSRLPLYSYSMQFSSRQRKPHKQFDAAGEKLASGYIK